MFTIRFETHNVQSVDYCVYQCANYRVFANDNLSKTVSLYETPGVPATQIEIGADAPFACAYVTNDSGRTVDTIRPNMLPGETVDAEKPRGRRSA